MRAAYVGLMTLGLAACSAAVPDSGVGFSDYNTYLRDREAQLQGTAAPAPAATAAPVTGFDPARIGSAIDAAESGVALPAPVTPYPATVPVPPTAGVLAGAPLDGTNGALAADRPRGNAPAGIAVESGEMAAASTGISDEQDFDAVASRESIESDAERLARNRAQYTEVAPTALPERTGDDRPNIVQYAINTRNSPGEQLYSRSSLRIGAGGCGRYTSSDQAQEDFLDAGGPDRDSKGLDPDGDGFACEWDPRPFRAALN